MMGRISRTRSRLGLMLILVGCLSACQGQPNTNQNTNQANSPPPSSVPTAVADPTASTETSTSSPSEADVDAEVDAEADATITAVQQPPIWVQTAAAEVESAAQVGTELTYGDILRTEADALAEVTLASGLAFRIGSETSVVLQPNNQLELSAGEMIAWVEPGKQVPTEIVTPAGVAGLRGTTIFIEISDEPDPEVHILAWEGTITFAIPGQDEVLTLRGGEGIRLRQGEQDIAALRAKIQQLNRRQMRRQRRQSLLHNGFDTPLPTQAQIDQVVEQSPE